MGSIIGFMAEVASIIRGPARRQADVYPVVDGGFISGGIKVKAGYR